MKNKSSNFKLNVIAEMGINHKGSEERAWQMLKKLVKTSVSAITFQVIDPVFYKKTTCWGGSLSKQFYKTAIDFAHKNNKNIGFAITDKDMIQFLSRSGADFWKTLSSSLNDKGLQQDLQKTGKIRFLSTGFSDEKEIVEAVKHLKNIKLIHTQLSSKIEDVNLRAIARLRALTNLDVAFGLHCIDFEVINLSLAFDPAAIFFYVKDGNQEKFPDDEHAVSLDQIEEIIDGLTTTQKALGSGIKKQAGNKTK